MADVSRLATDPTVSSPEEREQLEVRCCPGKDENLSFSTLHPGAHLHSRQTHLPVPEVNQSTLMFTWSHETKAVQQPVALQLTSCPIRRVQEEPPDRGRELGSHQTEDLLNDQGPNLTAKVWSRPILQM
jgi:hypothetical protein